jgi:hypothetical protein
MTEVNGVPTGFPSACTAIFSGIADSAEVVPAAATPIAVLGVPPAMVRGPLEGPVLLTRCQFAERQTVWLATTTAFQLRRRTVTVVEFEHFADGGALLWPGTLLESSPALRDGAPRIRGIDALRAVLELAPSYDPSGVLVTGHHARLSRPRADVVLALLVGNDDARNDWVALANAHGKVADQQAILKWAATDFGWGCDPGPIDNERGPKTEHAIHVFQRAYNFDRDGGLFGKRARLAVDGVVGTHTWGAMFDCVQRALRGTSLETQGTPAYLVVDALHETYPYELARLAAPGRDGNRWRELNPLNPSMPRPDGKGWYWPHVGQRIYLPESWDLQALVDAGYEVQPAQAAKDAPAAKALSPTGPRALGVGAHHLATPFDTSECRRAKERAVEVILFDPGERPDRVCSSDTPSPCTVATCELYDPREYDFAYVPLSGVPSLKLVAFRVLRIEDETPVLHSTAVLMKSDGSLVETATDGDGWVRIYARPTERFTLVRADDPREEMQLVGALAATPIT